MTRKIRLLLALLLLFVLLLSGCGGEEPKKSSIVPAATESPAAEPSSEPGPASESAPAEEGETAEAERQLSMGQFSGSTYINSYAGFGCTLDGSWQHSLAEVVVKINGAYFPVPNEKLEQTLDEEGMANVAVLSGYNRDSSDFIQLVYQKLSPEDIQAYASMNEEEAIDFVIYLMDDPSTLADGLKTVVTKVEKTTVNFLGQEHYAIKYYMKEDDVDVYMVQLIDHSRGSYAVTLSLGTYVEDNTQAVADLFFPLEE